MVRSALSEAYGRAPAGQLGSGLALSQSYVGPASPPTSLLAWITTVGLRRYGPPHPTALGPLVGWPSVLQTANSGFAESSPKMFRWAGSVLLLYPLTPPSRFVLNALAMLMKPWNFWAILVMSSSWGLAFSNVGRSRRRVSL